MNYTNKASNSFIFSRPEKKKQNQKTKEQLSEEFDVNMPTGSRIIYELR
jgi:hypothetical protein